jgi:hypothetical protein
MPSTTTASVSRTVVASFPRLLVCFSSSVLFLLLLIIIYDRVGMQLPFTSAVIFSHSKNTVDPPPPFHRVKTG